MYELPMLGDTIISIIEANNGINSVKLVIECMSILGPSAFETSEFEDTITELVLRRKVHEIGFILPKEDKMRFVYFPANTKIYLHRKQG